MLTVRTAARRAALTGVSLSALVVAGGTALAQTGGTTDPTAVQPPTLTQEAAIPGRTSMEEIVVTASPVATRREELLQGTSVLSGPSLDRALSPSLGDALARLPGVQQTGFGPAASRPVIRGLGGDRIRVLVGGIGTIDASTTSPDHAAAVDLATARRVEVLRGPATLLYGNNAVGGVVNLLDSRIPIAQPEGGADGFVRLGYGSNADERLGAAGLDLSLSPHIVAHVDAFWRRTDDYKVPGYLRSARLRAMDDHDHDHDDDHDHEEEQRRRVTNSDVDQKGATGGLSYVGDWGFLGGSVSRMEAAYGIPVHDHAHHDDEDDHDHDHDHGHDADHNVRLDLKQTRVDLMGEINRSFLAFEAVRLRFGYADYAHTEFEDGETGTVFANEGWEGRAELVQTPVQALGGTLTGALGVQFSDRDFSAIGEEAFVPPSTTFQSGAFLVQRLQLGALSVEGGARLERQTVKAEELAFDRDFTTVSLSTGLGYALGGGWFTGANLSRTQRAPNAEELLSNGPHLATSTYEVGDPTLGKETAWGGEVTLKFVDNANYLAVNAFATRYRDFIYERFTGEEEDGLPVAEYTAANARFWGFEVEAGTEQPMGPGLATLEASAEYVRARDTTNGHPVPRMPSLSARMAVGYELNPVAGRLELVWADKQTRTAPFELPTDSYTVLNASVDWRPLEQRDLTLMVEVRNITNEEVRLSTSMLKDRLPQPGRDYRISLRTGF